jgi:hypothetical protein
MGKVSNITVVRAKAQKIAKNNILCKDNFNSNVDRKIINIRNGINPRFIISELTMESAYICFANPLKKFIDIKTAVFVATPKLEENIDSVLTRLNNELNLLIKD